MIKASLLYIYNSSISLGIFPHQWKIAKVTPVQKFGPKENINNYRPISVLSSLQDLGALCEFTLTRSSLQIQPLK